MAADFESGAPICTGKFSDWRYLQKDNGALIILILVTNLMSAFLFEADK